jgi:C-terminal processing protease CtpA/Prc
MVIGHLVSERTPTVNTEDRFDPAASRSFHAQPRTPGYSKPVYVLIDGETGSGAEEFAYDLQVMGRATLVGQTTAGAATPGGFRPLAHGFAAFIPMQIVSHAVTGKNWEGTGVSPDVPVPAAESLAHAHRLALEAILKDAQGIHRAIAQEGLASLQPASAP